LLTDWRRDEDAPYRDCNRCDYERNSAKMGSHHTILPPHGKVSALQLTRLKYLSPVRTGEVRGPAYCPMHATGVKLTGPIVTMEQV
jgi:hypothetical protein